MDTANPRIDPIKDPISLASQAAELMLGDLADTPAPAEICRKLGVSEYRLKVAFRRCFGLPVATWLRRERMKKAARLLSEGDEKIAQVATMLGYRNASRFADAFRKEHGVFPSKYRTTVLSRTPEE